MMHDSSILCAEVRADVMCASAHGVTNRQKESDLLSAGFDKALGVGGGVVPLQLAPCILQVLLVALHAHA